MMNGKYRSRLTGEIYDVFEFKGLNYIFQFSS
jgi:hypothetical protein